MIPSFSQLAKAYLILEQRQATEKNLVQFSQWCRFDARLGQLLVVYVQNNWMHINPMAIRPLLKKQPWPASWAVILEHVACFIAASQREAFLAWKYCALLGIKAGQPELFFFQLRAWGRALMQRDVKQSLYVYSKWGFLCHQPLLPMPKEKTLLAKEQRMALLAEILRKKSVITVAQYRQALQSAVSLRQAQRDLESYPGVKASGFTQGRIYKKA